MEVKPGYKQTEVGIIPEDWDVVPFSRLFAFTNGVNADKTSYGKGVRFINVLEPIRYSHIYGPEVPGRVEVSVSAASTYSVRRGDIVFNRTSETDSDLGLAAVYLGSEHVVFGGFVIRGRPLDDTLDPMYSGYALRAKMIRSQIVPMGQGAVRSNISQQSLGRVLVAIPSKPEQRAIAAALSDVDALLGGLDGLIAKKRDLKQAVMQQLLTGQTRFPGFDGEWEMKRLGDHVVFLRHGVNSRSELLPEGRVKYLHYGDVHACKDVYLSPVSLPSLPDAKAASLDRLRDGDLILADASEDIAGVSKSVEVRGVGSIEVVSGLHTIAARFDKNVLADGFKAFLQFCPPFATQLRRLAAGTKVYATNRAHVASVEMRLPRVPEQTAIAAVLSDMDAELSALEARRDKTRALKQGMMQELLTGKTRLVPAGGAHA
jgi:type I restriction enzyme S subunit